MLAEVKKEGGDAEETVGGEMVDDGKAGKGKGSGSKGVRGEDEDGKVEGRKRGRGEKKDGASRKKAKKGEAVDDEEV